MVLVDTIQLLSSKKNNLLIKYIYNFLKNKKDNTNDSSSIENKIKYIFKDKLKLYIALTHKSIEAKPNSNYERFELIGDSIINLIVTDWLSQKYPNDNEGQITTKRASIVNTNFLSKISQQIGLEKNLIISKGVDMKNEIVSKNINADLYESITGAIFLDSNYETVKKFVLRTLVENYDLFEKKLNYKGLLIEFCHKEFNKPPIFNITSVKGPDHNKSFKVCVKLENKLYFHGEGKSIKRAQQEAAKNALKSQKII